MRKPKPSAVETFRLVVQRRVIEAQLGQGIAEILVVFGIHREHTGKHPRLHLLEAGQRRVAAAHFGGDGVAHRRAVDLLDAGDHETHFAGGKPGQPHRLGREAAELVDLVAAAVDMTFIFSPTRKVPFTTRTSDTTPT